MCCICWYFVVFVRVTLLRVCLRKIFDDVIEGGKRADDARGNAAGTEP